MGIRSPGEGRPHPYGTRLCLGSWVLAGVLGAADKEARFFDRRVAPILERRCLPCHNEQLKDGGISFVDRNSLVNGGPRGPAIVPGQPEQSVLIRAIRHDSEPKMPPGPKLPAKDIGRLTEWVRRGAWWGSRLRTR